MSLLSEAKDLKKLKTNQQWAAWFAAYLAGPEWSAKKSHVLARSKHQCEGCGIRPAIQVLHQSYEHAGDEFLFELLALCARCHDQIVTEAEAGGGSAS
jgi:hypothetical protein